MHGIASYGHFWLTTYCHLQMFICQLKIKRKNIEKKLLNRKGILNSIKAIAGKIMIEKNSYEFLCSCNIFVDLSFLSLKTGEGFGLHLLIIFVVFFFFGL